MSGTKAGCGATRRFRRRSSGTSYRRLRSAPILLFLLAVLLFMRADLLFTPAVLLFMRGVMLVLTAVLPISAGSAASCAGSARIHSHALLRSALLFVLAVWFVCHLGWRYCCFQSRSCHFAVNAGLFGRNHGHLWCRRGRFRRKACGCCGIGADMLGLNAGVFRVREQDHRRLARLVSLRPQMRKPCRLQSKLCQK